MYAIRSYYGERRKNQQLMWTLINKFVITSYSIHYTKLYDPRVSP